MKTFIDVPLNPDLPILDLRSKSAFLSGHYPNATHIEADTLSVRLNELPARPAVLQLLGDEVGLSTSADFLIEKGYEITALQTTKNYQNMAQKQPGLVVFDAISRPLWSPSALLKEALVWRQQHGFDVGHALDLGCGGGRDAVHLASQGWQVTAIDQEERVLQRARQLAHYNHVEIDWRACSLNQSDCFPDRSFDLIVVVRYLNRDLFDAMASALKPNGMLVFQTFVEGVETFGSPKNPNFILKKGELAKSFAEFHIIIDRIETIKDGRPVSSFVAIREK